MLPDRMGAEGAGETMGEGGGGGGGGGDASLKVSIIISIIYFIAVISPIAVVATNVCFSPFVGCKPVCVRRHRYHLFYRCYHHRHCRCC